MTRAITLADAWTELQECLPLSTPADQHVALRRAFYAGALAATEMKRDAVLIECIAFGRAVGTAAESASI